MTPAAVSSIVLLLGSDVVPPIRLPAPFSTMLAPVTVTLPFTCRLVPAACEIASLKAVST